MTEAKFQTQFSKWLKHCWLDNGKFELKLTKGKSLPFAAVKLHQELALLMNKVIYKIPDVGQDQKPFDCFCMYGVKGYVVVMFYRRGQKDFYMFEINEWMFLKNTSTRKSLTEEMANKHGIKYTLKG